MMSPSDSALGELVKDSVKDFPSINDLENGFTFFLIHTELKYLFYRITVLIIYSVFQERF